MSDKFEKCLTIYQESLRTGKFYLILQIVYHYLQCNTVFFICIASNKAVNVNTEKLLNLLLQKSESIAEIY